MDPLISHCTQAFAAHGALLPAFFIAGLTGGFTHCLAMCGPFVMCENMCASAHCQGSKSQHLRRMTGFSYHLGRMTTYGALGCAVALLSGQLSAYSWWPMLSSAMLAGAGVLFLLSCLKPACSHEHGVGKGSGLTYLRGALLGFIPCGLLYAALMMAATLADPFSGMVAMWVFTLGTIPALMIASLGAAYFSRQWQRTMQRAGRAMMALNGFSLLLMAVRTVR
jgi:sulfite exporter TauE/SafE